MPAAAGNAFVPSRHLGWVLAGSIAHGDDLPKLTRATFIGILVAVTGNILISLALNLQKLAHKRVEAQVRGKRDKETRNGNAPHPRGRRFDNPSLDERDEEHTHAAPPQNSTMSGSRSIETEPLVPFRPGSSPPTPAYGSFSPSVSGSTLNESRSVPSFTSRLVPSWLRRHKQGVRSSGALPNAAIPVDVVTEETSLHENSPSHNQKKGLWEDGHETDYLKSKLWWLGFFLMNVGETGNFISYAWAPASVVAPLGTFALMANCLFAPLLLRERFRKRDLLGILIAIIGAVTVVLASNASDTRLDPAALLDAISQTPFVVYSCVYLGGAVILGVLSHGEIGRRWVFIDVGMCALFGGFTVLSTKAISTLLTMEWIAMFSNWITYPTLLVLAVTGVGQIRYLNRALMRFDSKVVIPTQFVLFTLSAIIGSAILYGDFKKAKFHQIVTFLYGCAATFLGVFIIAWSPNSNTDNDDPEDGLHSEPVSNVNSSDASHRLGSIGRKNRATLIMPSGAKDTPALRNQHNNVSLLGLSPAQHLLLVHTPPRDVPIHNQYRNPTDTRRRRTMSWLDDGSRDSASPSRTTESSRPGLGNHVGSLDNDTYR